LLGDVTDPDDWEKKFHPHETFVVEMLQLLMFKMVTTMLQLLGCA
jgi:hypothetical protein